MEFLKQHKIKYYEHVDLSNYTTYKLTATAKYLVIPKDIKELQLIIKYVKAKNIKYMILGNGSNVIFAKSFYDGMLIKLDNFKHLAINENIVIVGSGYNLIKLAYKTARLGLSGLEFASGIPGTVGGAVYMNAGAYNKSISDVISEVKVLTNLGDIITLKKDELLFGYRSSIFQKNKDYIILEATFNLDNKDSSLIMELINDRKNRRLNTQPLEYPSAGSVFRNPLNDYAGHLIEELGYKGKTFGDLEVSAKHANFIINKGHATGQEIKALIHQIKQDVKQHYHLDLIIEQEIIE